MDRAPFMHDAGGVGAQAPNGERRRIDEDFTQRRKVAAAPVQQQQTGLGGDGHPHVVGHVQSVAADKGFFGDEYLDVLLELELQVGRQQPDLRHTLAQDGPPGRRERPAAQPAAARLDAQRFGEQPDRRNQRQQDEEEQRHVRPVSPVGVRRSWGRAAVISTLPCQARGASPSAAAPRKSILPTSTPLWRRMA